MKTIISGIFQDLRWSLPAMRKPTYAITIVLSLVLGIGVNCAIFTIVNAVLLRPLPFPNYERLVRVFSVNTSSGSAETNVSYQDFKDWQQARTLEHMAAYATGGAFLTGDGPSERVGAAGVTPDFFLALGAHPLVGRTLGPDDEDSGSAVISYGLWQRHYAGRPDILGHKITFNGNAGQIVGVLPAEIVYPEHIDLWTAGVDTKSARDSRGLGVIACRRNGIGLKESQLEVATIAARLATAYPDTNRTWQVRVVSLRELRSRGTAPGVLLSLAGAMVLLLIACANIGAIQLVRVAQRRHELALRFALGASRLRVATLVVVEALLLSFSGATIGLLVMFWSVRFLIRSGILQFGSLSDVPLDWRVISFAIATSVGATLLFSMAPLQQALSLPAGGIVPEGDRGGTSSIRVRRLHSWLVSGQLSLALVLLIAALLLNTSFRNVEHVDLGFDPQGVLTGRVAYFNDENRIEFFHRVVDRLRGLPGVSDIATSYSLPLDAGSAYFRPAVIPLKSQTGTNQQMIASYHIISPGYFRVLRITFESGRDFSEADTQQSEPVAIVNESLARRMFGDMYPVGQRIACCEGGKFRTVVGVVRNLKSESPESPAGAEIYVPFDQDNQVSTRLLVLTTGDPKQLVPEIRNAIASVDPQWPVYDVRTMNDIYDSVIAPRRSQLILIGSFALVAMVLAVVGVYGTFTYATANRSREFAIRIALGATRETILQLVLKRAVVLISGGVSAGTTLAVLASRAIRGLLFGVSAFQINLYAEAAALLISTALICSLIPAIRASRTNAAAQLHEL